MDDTRRSFMALLVGTGAAALLARCGGSSGGASDGGSGGGDGGPVDCSVVNNTIEQNHGHTLTVTPAEVAAGTAKIYDISGGGGHAHTVTLTPAHFQTLRTSGTVTVGSSSEPGHNHSITVRCG